MRFTIRDLLWLTLLAAVLVAWWIRRRRKTTHAFNHPRPTLANSWDTRMIRGMVQAVGVLLAGFIAMIAPFGYLRAFIDELDPNAPANANGGPLSPMFRHCAEAYRIATTCFITVSAGYFWLCGWMAGLRFDWDRVRYILFWAHVASGVIILASLTIATVQGERVEVRDGITALAGGFLLLLSVCDLVIPRNQDSQVFDFELRDDR
jgi:magnesium-transporting ATPase (P-type)